MRISEAKAVIAGIFAYNLAEYEAARANGRSAHQNFIVPMLEGAPGVGKTAAGRQAAAELEVPYFQTIVAQYDAGEMAGLSMRGTKEYDIVNEKGEKTGTRQVERMVRLRPTYLPDIDDPNQQIGIYCLDELPQAFVANQNICSQLVNEYRIGDHALSQGITVMATGNRPEDKAGTQPMPAHLKDRLMFLEIEVDAQEWVDYSATVGIDPRIRAYISRNHSKLFAFDPKLKANPTPRSWEKCSAILALDLPAHIRNGALTGQIGKEAASFEAWLRVEKDMPNIDDILRNPKDAPLFGSNKPDVLHLLIANLVEVANEKNLKPMIDYIVRLKEKEYMMVWGLDLVRRHPNLKNHKLFTDWKIQHAPKQLLAS